MARYCGYCGSPLDWNGLCPNGCNVDEATGLLTPADMPAFYTEGQGQLFYGGPAANPDPARNAYGSTGPDAYDDPSQTPYGEPAQTAYGDPARTPYDGSDYGEQPAYDAPERTAYDDPAQIAYGEPEQNPYSYPVVDPRPTLDGPPVYPGAGYGAQQGYARHEAAPGATRVAYAAPQPEKQPKRATPAKPKKGGRGKKIALIAGICVLAAALTVGLLFAFGVIRFKGKDPLVGEVYFLVTPAEHIQTDADTGLRYADNELLVVARPGVKKRDMETVAKKYHAAVVGFIEVTGDYQLQLEEPLSKDALEQLAVTITSEPEIADAEPNRVVTLRKTTPAPAQGTSETPAVTPETYWNLRLIRAYEAWTTVNAHKNEITPVAVGMIADGAPTGHKDIPLKESFFANNGNVGHALAIAGIMAADGTNADGFSGVYPYANGRLFAASTEGMGDSGVSVMWEKAAIAKLLVSGVKVLNCGYGTEMTDFLDLTAAADTLGDYLNRSLNAGYDFLLVAPAPDATGESTLNAIDRTKYPNVCAHILTTGGSDEDGQPLASGTHDLLAPQGKETAIYSAVPGGYGFVGNDAELAAPHAAGAAALVWSVDERLTGDAVRRILISTAQANRLLDVNAAVTYALENKGKDVPAVETDDGWYLYRCLHITVRNGETTWMFRGYNEKGLPLFAGDDKNRFRVFYDERGIFHMLHDDATGLPYVVDEFVNTADGMQGTVLNPVLDDVSETYTLCYDKQNILQRCDINVYEKGEGYFGLGAWISGRRETYTYYANGMCKTISTQTLNRDGGVEADAGVRTLDPLYGEIKKPSEYQGAKLTYDDFGHPLRADESYGDVFDVTYYQWVRRGEEPPKDPVLNALYDWTGTGLLAKREDVYELRLDPPFIGIQGADNLTLRPQLAIYLETDLDLSGYVGKEVTLSGVLDYDGHNNVFMTDVRVLDNGETPPPAPKPTGKRLTPEEAVEIYLENMDLWKTDLQYPPMGGYEYLFLDLDFDGTLELITAICDGSERNSINRYFRIDPDSRTVQEIPFSENVHDYIYVGQSPDGFDYTIGKERTSLLRSKTDGSLVYYCHDRFRYSDSEGSDTHGLLHYDGGKIWSEYLFGEGTIRENGSIKDSYNLYEGDEIIKTTEQTHHEKRAAFFAEYDDLHLTLGSIFCTTLTNAGKPEQRQLLLDAYLSFSYDGFSFDSATQPQPTAPETTQAETTQPQPSAENLEATEADFAALGQRFDDNKSVLNALCFTIYDVFDTFGTPHFTISFDAEKRHNGNAAPDLFFLTLCPLYNIYFTNPKYSSYSEEEHLFPEGNDAYEYVSFPLDSLNWLAKNVLNYDGFTAEDYMSLNESTRNHSAEIDGNLCILVYGTDYLETVSARMDTAERQPDGTYRFTVAFQYRDPDGTKDGKSVGTLIAAVREDGGRRHWSILKFDADVTF